MEAVLSRLLGIGPERAGAALQRDFLGYDVVAGSYRIRENTAAYPAAATVLRRSR